MSAKSQSSNPEFSDENILTFIRTYEEPCITAGELADEFGVTNEAANYRLKKLLSDDKVREKKVGASAKVWYLVG